MVDEYNSGFKVKPDGTLIIELEDGSSIAIDDFNDLAQETTLSALKDIFDTAGADDVGLLIEALEGKDFASETTLDALKTSIDTEYLPSAIKETTHHENTGENDNLEGAVAEIGGYGPTGFQITGTMGTADVIIEVSQDETNWDETDVIINDTGFVFNDLAGAKFVRTRIDGPDADTSITAKSLSVGMAVAENVTVKTEPVGSDTFDHDDQDVSTAGTSVQLPDISCREVTISAKKDNTGTIYIGGSTVSNASYGVYLDAGDSFTKPVANTNLIYIDADENGDGIVFCYA